MTKPRAPLTYDNALSRIAGQIGWDAMAVAVGQKERTVRDWGDPDLERGCPIEAAELLDLAFQAGGGDGAPMHETYTLRLDVARQSKFADQVAMARAACTLIREGSEASEAMILASLPGATMAARRTALRELEEFIAAAKSAIPLLIEHDSVQTVPEPSVHDQLIGEQRHQPP